MKRSTASWTTAIAALALLAMPVGSWAQQTSPTPSQTTSRPPGAQTDQQGSANEHLRQAEAALSDIPAASLTGANKAKVAELKRHVGALGRTAASATAPAAKATWSTEVAAADRILTELLGAQGTTGATGTTGSTSTRPGAQSKSSTPATATLDESARAKLQEVRTHLTAFAASMSGTGKTSGASTPSADDPASPASASAAAAPSATTASPAASAPAPATPSAQAPTPSAPSTPATPSEPSAAAATPPAQGQPGQAASPAQSVDTESVKRHLTAARDSLSQMTQLPAAAQLTGDARTQVSQLISNFNELITTNASWKASYDKVQANLTALIGEQRADESPTPAAGTAGAVGTSGTTALDPGIRGKLVEFRTHLMEFEKAAGGGSSASASSPSAATPASASPSSPSAATPSPDTAAAAASTAAPDPASATPAASPSASPAPTATPEPSPTGTSGRSSSTPSPAGTSGTTAPPAGRAAASEEPQERPSSAAQSSSAQRQGMSSDAMRHIEAIESILNGSASVGTTGSSESKTAKGSVTSLDRAQIEQIRTHLAALRKALNESK